MGKWLAKYITGVWSFPIVTTNPFFWVDASLVRYNRLKLWYSRLLRYDSFVLPKLCRLDYCIKECALVTVLADKLDFLMLLSENGCSHFSLPASYHGARWFVLYYEFWLALCLVFEVLLFNTLNLRPCVSDILSLWLICLVFLFKFDGKEPRVELFYIFCRTSVLIATEYLGSVVRVFNL